ncbi:hypothetical protein ZWY2020_018865 [Hordeum vulgare]|nr:hypothetical protein ZWY2020_018865 [Hordeum vulgare]
MRHLFSAKLLPRLIPSGEAASTGPRRQLPGGALTLGAPQPTCDLPTCSTVKKPMGRIDDVLIVANKNYVPVDFIVLDIDCNPSCPIILGRPFLRTIGAIIDMKEGNIRFQFPLKKGMEHFPRKKIRLPYESMMRATYGLSTKDDYT